MKAVARGCAHLAVLGAGLLLAGLHAPADGHLAAPAPPAVAVASSYVPPALASTAPSAAVHTLGDTGVAATKPPARAAKRPPVARRTTTSHHATAVAVHHAARPAKRSARPAAAPRPTSFTAALARAVARIPTYRPGAARWVVSRAYAFWGTADWYHDVLYVSPDVPVAKLYDVAVHEWSHELSVLDYAGDVRAATAAMNAWFGGTGLTGPERAADCMAVLQGARWTHYTTCTNATWRAGAARLVAGHHL